MTDVFTPEQRSAVMRRVRGCDTGPEMVVRRRLRAAGIGYRLGGCGLPGRPDLVMAGRRLALFVHGCFWHGHDCPRGARAPKANAAYWTAKIARNRARDAAAQARLAAAGWRCEVVWECALRTSGWDAELLARIQPAAASAATVVESSAPASTCDSAPSSEPGVSGLETK